jgi:hypothetical protein
MAAPHATTVERVIGNKTRAGGTAGVSYLRRVVLNISSGKSRITEPNCNKQSWGRR